MAFDRPSTYIEEAPGSRLDSNLAWHLQSKDSENYLAAHLKSGLRESFQKAPPQIAISPPGGPPGPVIRFVRRLSRRKSSLTDTRWLSQRKFSHLGDSLPKLESSKYLASCTNILTSTQYSPRVDPQDPRAMDLMPVALLLVTFRLRFLGHEDTGSSQPLAVVCQCC